MRWIGRRTRRPVRSRLRWWQLLVTATAAAWVQAVGAIIALGLTVWLAYDARSDVERKAIVTTHAAMDAATAAFHQVYVGCSDKNRNIVSFTMPVVEEASDLLRQVNTQELPRDVLTDALKSRSLIARSRGVLKHFEEQIATAANDDPIWSKCSAYALATRDMIEARAAANGARYQLGHPEH